MDIGCDCSFDFDNTNSIDMDKNMLPIGTLLNGGRYKVVKHLSSGGFGKTYVVEKVFHRGELYAMKEFFIKGVNSRRGNTVIVSNDENEDTFESQKSKFLTEAERLRDIENEHIVRVHDFFSDNETCYYIMDLIDGESLDAVKKPLKEEKVWDILNQVLDALSTIHQKKTIDNKKERIWLHLDIKPANLMIDKGGKVTLIDFGASKQLSANNNDLSLSMSQMSFTRGYAPIEQTSQNFDSIGPWTDFYALGATLYKLLTEKDSVIPEYSELAEILYSNDDIIKAFKFPKNISEKMRNLITWLMNPNRKKRPQSVQEIRNYMRQTQSIFSRLSPEPETTSFGGIAHGPNSPVLSHEMSGQGKQTDDEDTFFDLDVQSSTKQDESIIATKSYNKITPTKDRQTVKTNEETIISVVPHSDSDETYESWSKNASFFERHSQTIVVSGVIILFSLIFGFGYVVNSDEREYRKEFWEKVERDEVTLSDIHEYIRKVEPPKHNTGEWNKLNRLQERLRREEERTPSDEDIASFADELLKKSK